MDYGERLEYYRRMTEDYLTARLPDTSVPYGKLIESMRYSLLAGGKRLRPVLTLEFTRVCGGDVAAALPVAGAVEMLHTYSLIHDDLPCMDDDDMRRGNPTNHIVFGEFTATLAGDALQAEAFASVLSAELPDSAIVRCAAALADAAGHRGICGGQQMDMESEGADLSEAEITDIQMRKTSALISAACLMGVYAGGGGQAQETAALEYARNLGAAFQIRDDILDVTSTRELLGKTTGSDARRSKPTFVSARGLEESGRQVAIYTQAAKAGLRGAFEDTRFLEELADSLLERKY